MISREALEAQIAELKRQEIECIKGLMARFRTTGMDATDRAAAAQARISVDDARLLRIHRETAQIAARIAELRAAIELL
ncbi:MULTISPECIES: hypothetical protein [unclassified Sphingobium]|uniref:hypothetical protein n=1 Tax=unclassified Sphingobium TaxID=2611147 RepID=UPI0012906F5D|nr:MULTISPECIES: hypothetical protein [unclassified Sphingobium]